MSPVFAHGQLRLYLLALLSEGPRHGYDLIQGLSDRFDGLYAPSAGTVYPRLAKLEEEGLVAKEDDGRKVIYRLTPSGEAEVSGRRDDIARLERDLDRSAAELADDVRARVKGSTKSLRAELAGAAKQARANAKPVGDSGPISALESDAAMIRAVVRQINRRGSDEQREAARQLVQQTRQALEQLLGGGRFSSS